jgi:hypothetical protein
LVEVETVVEAEAVSVAVGAEEAVFVVEKDQRKAVVVAAVAAVAGWDVWD